MEQDSRLTVNEILSLVNLSHERRTWILKDLSVMGSSASPVIAFKGSSLCRKSGKMIFFRLFSFVGQVRSLGVEGLCT